METQQALQVLYNASRLAKLSADEHAQVGEAAKVIQDAITPKEESKSEKRRKEILKK